MNKEKHSLQLRKQKQGKKLKTNYNTELQNAVVVCCLMNLETLLAELQLRIHGF